jgi:signal transduction histidine kinase
VQAADGKLTLIVSLLSSFKKQPGNCWCSCIVVVTFAIGWFANLTNAQEQGLQSAKQIVILYTHRTLTPINADWDRGIRSALSDGWNAPLDIEIEYLNLVRHNDPDYLQGWIELLKTKYAVKQPDLIVPVYVPALEFTLEHRETLFPNIPIVFCSAPVKLAQQAHNQPNVTGVAFRLDIAGTVETAVRLHPANRRLMVLSGSSDIERGLKRATQDMILASKTGMNIEFVEGLPRKQLLEKVVTADRNTSILMLTYEEDTQGTNYSTAEIIEQIAATTSAPMYGLYDTLLGHGIVGGSLQSAEAQGKLAGELAVRVLKGERPDDMPIVGLDTIQKMFDARQLRRLNISIGNLPPGSQVLYVEPTFWEQFGRYVLLGATAILIQALIIAALLVNRTRRVRAEHEARDLAGKILTAQEDERRYLAREMHDDISQRLAASAIEAGNLEQRFLQSSESYSALGSLKNNLIAICDDVHRLSRQIHPAILDDFGLADALHVECDRFADREQVEVEFRAGDLPADLPKEVALCLYRIAQESLWNAAKYAQTDRVTVELSADSEFVHLEIRDFGRGFDPLQLSDRQGLGLASMKERARLVRGKIQIDSAPRNGTTITVQVPIPDGEA